MSDTYSWTYTISSTESGAVNITTGPADSNGIYTAESASGTFDGSTITGLNEQFTSPDNLFSLTAPGFAYGIDGNGVSFNLANGLEVNFYYDVTAPAFTYSDSGGTAENVQTNPTFSTTACFATGTNVTTGQGSAAVEALSVGDLVQVASGGFRPIRWIGRSGIVTARHPKPWDVMPIRVTAGAFGPGLPTVDLRLSPDHAIYVDGVLIPVRRLINDATIAQEKVEEITYWHVELASHDIILAEGLPVESYLDTGNRAAFDGGDKQDLHPVFGVRDEDAWARHACAELVEQGPKLEAVRERLTGIARAATQSVTRTHVVTVCDVGVSYFVVPPHCERVCLRSVAQRPPGESRWLGAAIAGLRLGGETIALASDALARGFHVRELWDAAEVRWTNGEAILLLPPTATPRSLEVVTLLLADPGTQRIA